MVPFWLSGIIEIVVFSVSIQKEKRQKNKKNSRNGLTKQNEMIFA